MAPVSEQVADPTTTRRWKYDRRYTAPLLITGILVSGHLSFGILESYDKTLLAIATSILAEMILGKTLRGSIPHLASAYISGISVGILVRSPLYWPFALCSLLSITSKYAIRYRNQHIFNPSNFGICALLFLAPYAIAPLSVQWGNYLLPMVVIWIIGSITIARLHRFHICLTYVAGFIAFAGLRSMITGHAFLAELAPITGPMYQLFIFFMITDPRTTVRSKKGQILVAFLVAFFEFVFRLGESVYAPFYALFVVGPPALLLEMWWTQRKSGAEKNEQEALVTASAN